MRTLPFLLAATAIAAVLSGPAHGASSSYKAEVVVGLEAPPLARAIELSRAISARGKRGRLDLRTPTSEGYLAQLARVQRSTERRIETAIPGARIRWRYKIVLDGLAVELPRARIPDLARIPGVARLYPEAGYRAALGDTPGLIGADQLWGLPSFSTAGNGIKIGIIDDGVDQSHPFLSAAGYAYPPGFPKGNRAFTTPKVIAARAFAPASNTWKYARQPFDPVKSEHATHVAGIAAGNFLAGPVLGRKDISGIAPRAYLGNYKALTTPSDRFGLLENAPEIVAAIEAAVRDGMDVINMSFGEVEIEPSRNVVVAAVDGAAAAGVVPVIAAGNSFDFGFGSVSSPGSARSAITAAAVTKDRAIAGFSSAGPTPISLQLKPDVSAPGVSVFSSIPEHFGRWAEFSGTSMAAPHVAGAAALLRQRHPTWTVAQVKSALVTTGDPVRDETKEVPTTREGGGLINLPRADQPLLFASPCSLSFGLLRPGSRATRTIELTDAGGGAGPWEPSIDLRGPKGATVTVPATGPLPGKLTVRAAAARGSADGEATGFVVLRRGGEVRRVPFWLRVAKPRLGSPVRTITRPGVYGGDTGRGRARVTSYRYPDAPEGLGFPVRLPGPEQVFRVRIGRRVANFGVHVLSTARGVRVTPRIVVAGDENRLTGVPALPIDINPYRGTSYGDAIDAAAAIAPAPGSYDVVFDTVSRRRAGKFTFRLWIDDRRPPRAALLTRTALRDGRLLVKVTDAGAGVDGRRAEASVDGREVGTSFDARTGRVLIVFPAGIRPGRHRLVLLIADYQESKNMENVGGILPNTTVLRTTFRVR